MMPGSPGNPGYPPNPPGPYGAPAGGFGTPSNYGVQQQPQQYGAHYGAPSPYHPGAGAMTPFGAPPPPPMGAIGPMGYGPQMMGMGEQKNPGLAVALELIFGSVFQTFGVGHLYAGNIGVGLAWMFGYWIVTAINFCLMFVLVGFVTWPLCWIAAMIISSMTAAAAAKRFNMRGY